MTKFIKVVLIVVVVVVGAILIALAKELPFYGNPVGYIIICPAVYFAIKAIWKYKSDK